MLFWTLVLCTILYKGYTWSFKVLVEYFSDLILSCVWDYI